MLKCQWRTQTSQFGGAKLIKKKIVGAKLKYKNTKIKGKILIFFF
jgi:hypothetical protein